MVKQTKTMKKSKGTKKNKSTNPWFAFIKQVQVEKGIKKWGDAIKEAIKQKPRYHKEKKNLLSQKGGNHKAIEEDEPMSAGAEEVEETETEVKMNEGGDDEGEIEGEIEEKMMGGKKRRRKSRSTKKRKGSKTKKHRKSRRR